MDHGILRELVLVYALAVVLLLVAGALRLPSIVALIGAGIIAGPGGVGLVHNEGDVELMAEIGVALLLFTAGLEFSLAEMRRVWRSVVPGGLGQIAVTTTLTAAIVIGLFGGSMTRAAVLGLFVTLSSTAVVLKEFAVRNQMHAMHGRLATGVLLLQDLVVIAVLATTPTLLGDGASTVGSSMLKLALGGAGLMLIGGLILPRLLRRASAISREAFALSVLLASVGTAWIAALVGLSMAAGAFLAGLVLAESEFSHQVHADVRPLRDLLASLFFVSVGMLVDVRQLLPVLPAIVALAAGVMLLKTLTATAAFRLGGAPLGVAIAAAIALAQVGEFSFVLGRTALNAGVISQDWWQLLLGASVLTMAVTPYLVASAPALATRFAPRGGPKLQESDDAFALRNHVIILGYGIGGQLLVKSLSELKVDYVVLELNGATVRKARAQGIAHIHYADGTMAEPLEAAGIKDAAALIAVLSDPDASQRAVRTARELAPNLPIIARTRYRLEAERLTTAGATLAVAEELEASLEVLSQLLARLHVPGNIAETLVDGYRRSISASATRPSRAPAIPLDQLPADVRDVPVSTFRLTPEAWAIDRTLQDIDLRAATGATVLAIRRNGRMTTSPPSVFTLKAGDDIYLLGDDSDILLARSLLTDGPRPSRGSATEFPEGVPET